MNCSPTVLANAARCFKSCAEPGNLQAIKNYLLCSTFNHGGLKPGGGPTDPVVTDWAARVVTNGGAAPSVNTVSAMSTFVGTLKAAGIDNNMIAVCCFVPDNLIACITPLYKTFGADPWINNGFVSGDVTVNGLQGNGAKYLDTQLFPNQIFPLGVSGPQAGISVYVMDGVNGGQGELGALSGGANLYMVVDNPSGQTQVDCYGGSEGSSQLTFSNPLFKGFLAMCRTNISRMDVYGANTTTPFANLGTATGNIGSPGTSCSITMLCMALNINSSVTNVSTKRMSFCALHKSMTSAQTQTFFNAVQALRVSLGGGYTPGVVDDWAARVVTNGGAAPSAGTKAALNTFVSALQTAGIDSKMIAVNCMVPDNLIAALTPLYKVTGNDPWTNHGFLGTDLSTGGLQGGGTKYLDTGVVPFSALSQNDAGLTVYIVNTAGAWGYQLGTADVSYWFDLQTWTGNIYFDCYDQSSGRIVTSIPNYGYFSGNRSGSNDHELYFANGSTAHSSIASSNTPGGNPPGNPILGYAYTGTGTQCGHLLSFLAIHKGLSTSQSLSFFNAVQALRTALGGGWV